MTRSTQTDPLESTLSNLTGEEMHVKLQVRQSQPGEDPPDDDEVDERPVAYRNGHGLVATGQAVEVTETFSWAGLARQA